MTARPILIMAGGTGGHVYPALAVADHLRRAGKTLLWLGTRQGLEYRIVPQAGIALTTISISGLRGKGAFTWIAAPFKLLISIVQALRILLLNRPVAVLGLGGFVSGPGGLAAWLLRVPLLIHEQNAIAGMTNKYLAPLATVVMETFPGTFPQALKAIHTGNPVRREIIAIPSPEIRLSEKSYYLKVLVVGGSLGAEVLNQQVPAALAVIRSKQISVWHQTGQHHDEETRARYEDVEMHDVRIEPFIENMAEAYGWANLVICRAGALTVAELAAAGIASVLVPYPHAVDDHQTVNARYLCDAGAAVLLPQDELTDDRLAHLLEEFCRSPQALLSMSEKARQLATGNATARVAGLCLEVIDGRS